MFVLHTLVNNYIGYDKPHPISSVLDFVNLLLQWQFKLYQAKLHQKVEALGNLCTYIIFMDPHYSTELHNNSKFGR